MVRNGAGGHPRYGQRIWGSAVFSFQNVVKSSISSDVDNSPFKFLKMFVFFARNFPLPLHTEVYHSFVMFATLSMKIKKIQA